MYTQLHAGPAHRVLFNLCHVVGDVINLVEVVRPHLARQHFLKGAPDVVCQRLAVGKGKVRRAGHRAEILLSFLGLKGRAYQFAVGKLDAIVVHRLLKARDIVLADLVAKAARAAVDLHHRLAGEQTEALGRGLVVNRGDGIHLNEVIAGAQRADLAASTFPRLVRNVFGIGPGHRAELLCVLQVLVARQAAMSSPARAFH